LAADDTRTGTDAPIVDPAAWTCPVPLRDHDRIVTGHGGGGRLSKELVEHLFLPAFGGSPADPAHDSIVLPMPTSGRLAFSTDGYVVTPLFFPGGCIGDLAVNGTVNDLAMSGAVPVALSTAFVVEEGLELATLGAVAEAMGRAAKAAEVRLVTGDTKVVEARGGTSGLYVTTAGFGVVPDGIEVGPHRARPGDRVIVSGPIGQHGMAIMSLREGLAFDSELTTDSAPLGGLVQTMLAASPSGVHTLRDATRGGFAAVLCELAEAGGVGVEYDERAVPVPSDVAAACAFLGLDPTHVANEGKLVAFVTPDEADAVLAAMRSHPEGRDAVIVGDVVADHAGLVVARTGLGAKRVVDLPLGEQLPRIC
jgi:hydrogenase expression/formation protein HypE